MYLRHFLNRTVVCLMWVLFDAPLAWLPWQRPRYMQAYRPRNHERGQKEATAPFIITTIPKNSLT